MQAIEFSRSNFVVLHNFLFQTIGDEFFYLNIGNIHLHILHIKKYLIKK